jgi:hypothetical protein
LSLLAQKAWHSSAETAASIASTPITNLISDLDESRRVNDELESYEESSMLGGEAEREQTVYNIVSHRASGSENSHPQSTIIQAMLTENYRFIPVLQNHSANPINGFVNDSSRRFVQMHVSRRCDACWDTSSSGSR